MRPEADGIPAYGMPESRGSSALIRQEGCETPPVPAAGLCVILNREKRTADCRPRP